MKRMDELKPGERFLYGEKEYIFKAANSYLAYVIDSNGGAMNIPTWWTVDVVGETFDDLADLVKDCKQ